MQKQEKQYKCTNCGGDAMMAYVPETVKRGKNKGKQKPSWYGLVQPGERLCLSCGKRRGINFF